MVIILLERRICQISVVNENISAVRDIKVLRKIVSLPPETDIISQKMNTRKLFFPIFLLWTFPACFAQSTTSQGPKIKMDVAARLAVLADDDRYLCFSAVDRNGQNKDDEMFIVVYDKVSRTVVQDHEIDEDYGFSSAFIRGDNVVLEGSKYNKKTKSVDFFQYAFPVKEKRKGRVVTTTVYSVPAVGMKQSFSLILHSPDKQKLAYVTYLKPQKRNLDGYTIDVNVCDLAGTEINRVSATISGLCPFFGKGFLSNDGTVYLEEHIKDNRYRYVTFTSGEVKYVPSEELVEGMYNPCAALLPDQRLMVFGVTENGVGTVVLDAEGNVVHSEPSELTIPNEPENVKYEKDFNKKVKMSFKPHQILPLQDGRVLVLAHLYLYWLVSNGRSVTSYHDHKNLYLFLFDNEMNLSEFETRPYASVNKSTNHEDIPIALEWHGETWLLFNGNVMNYKGGSNKEWKVTTSLNMQERCLVMGTLDESLHFTPKIIRNPGNKVMFSYGEFFEQLLEVTEDAIYYINYRGNDNYIEEIR